MKKCFLLFISLAATFLVSGLCFPEEEKASPLEAIEFLSGYSWGELKWQDDYIVYPLIVDFDFELKSLLNKTLNYHPKHLAQFQVEPFISLVSSPDSNVEVGTSFFLKVGILQQTLKFQPYLKAGAGIIFISQHTRMQGSQFNFTQTLGAGFHYFLSENTALTLEYRLRHLSNAEIKYPNRGIDTESIIGGITYKF